MADIGDIFGDIFESIYVFLIMAFGLIVFSIMMINIALLNISKNEVSRFADMLKDEGDKSGVVMTDAAFVNAALDDFRAKGGGKRTHPERYKVTVIGNEHAVQRHYGSTARFIVSYKQPMFALPAKTITEERSFANRGYFGDGYKNN